MVIVIGAFIVSLIPAVLLYFYLKLKCRVPADENYQKSCKDALIKGVLSTFLVILLSGIFALIGKFTGLTRGASVLGSAYHTFIVLALMEECAKVFMFTQVLKKAEFKYTWLDITALMVIVSLGFEILESLVYVFESGPIQILVRGITVMHGGFGFIEGWFIGKSAYTGNKTYGIIGFVLAWLFHGFYDFGLSEPFLALGDWTAFLSVSLAVVALILFIFMIIFFVKKDKKEQYLVPVEKSAAQN